MRKSTLVELLLLTIIVTVTVRLTCETWRNVQEAKRTIPPPASVITVTKGPPDSMMPPEHVAVVKEAYDNFVVLAEKSERAAELLHFFDESSIAGTFVDWKHVLVHADPAAPTWFVVRVSPPTPNPLHGGYFICRDRVMNLINDGERGISAAIRLAHETKHAYDCLAKGDMDVGQTTTLPSEREAYRATRDILDEWTDGEWSLLADTWAEEHNSWTNARGLPPDLPLVDWSPGMPDDVQALLGDEAVSGTIVTTLVIDAGLRNAARHCPTEVEVCELEYLAAFYKAYGNPAADVPQ